MAWQIAVIGTIDIDDVRTPRGEALGLLGGSAVYAGLAASRFAPVLLHGSVGEDSAALLRETLAGLDIDITGVSISRAPTRRWRASHDFTTWQTSSENVEGGDAGWSPMLTADAVQAPVLFLGSMSAKKQREAVKQSQARLIGVDSMSAFIDLQADDVRYVAERADILFLTQYELAGLTNTGSKSWVQAARSLLRHGRPRAVVVKHGPAGAALVTEHATFQEPAPSVTNVIDPTGAGDAVAGGFLGSCALAERDDCEYFVRALRDGVRSAAATLTTFGIKGLLQSLTCPSPWEPHLSGK